MTSRARQSDAPQERRDAMASSGADRPPQVRLRPLNFAELSGFAADDHLEAFAVFARHAAAILADKPVLRSACAPSPALRAACRHALDDQPKTAGAARRFFETNFAPFQILPEASATQGFVTGYYEPVFAGSLTRTAQFCVPIFGRPDDLVSVPPGRCLPGLEPGLTAARRRPDGGYAPYPDRAAIEAGALAGLAAPLVWLKEPLEVFIAQVQGSLRVSLPDGRELRFAYAGRNGQPYSSIGRILVEAGEIEADKMSFEKVSAWVKRHGQGPGEAGATLLARNKSYVFFAPAAGLEPCDGPIGGAGLSLSPLRSIAIDRSLWCYGLPFWFSADPPWQTQSATPFRRLMIAGDTGTAIVGPARADIFFGSGRDAGQRAGSIRHGCDVVALLPRTGETQGTRRA